MMFRDSPSLQTITATRSVHRHAERSFHPVATAATPTPAWRAGNAADAGRVWAWSIDATGTALPAWSLTAPTACTGDAFGHAIAPDSATLAVGAYATDGAAQGPVEDRRHPTGAWAAQLVDTRVAKGEKRFFEDEVQKKKAELMVL